MGKKEKRIQIHWEQETGPEAQERLLRAFEMLIKALPPEVIEEALKNADVDKTE
jgi:hypothetical protein